MNELSAKSAAAVQPKPELPTSTRRPASEPTAQGRLTEMQLQQLLVVHRDTRGDQTAVAELAASFGASADDESLMHALSHLDAPVIGVDLAGNKVGVRAAESLDEFGLPRPAE